MENQLNGSMLRWSGGEGNDDVEAVYVSVKTFQLEIFDDLIGTNTLNLDYIRKNCSILSHFREHFIADVMNSSFKRTGIE